ncbi:hypothetical protein BDN72DRAFT_778848, partial [Pluteus cervinus]
MTSWNASTFSIRGLSVEAAYGKLDAEIVQLEARLSALKTIRNSLAPISKIPTELLSRIFRNCPKDSTFPFSDENLDVNTRFFVSWVCRHWRSTALATPSLWTVISKKSREVPIPHDFVQELLVRSRGLNIAISLFDPSPDMLKTCLSELPRMQHLRLL